MSKSFWYFDFAVDAPIVFDVDAELRTGDRVLSLRGTGIDLVWLPRGAYRLRMQVPAAQSEEPVSVRVWGRLLGQQLELASGAAQPDLVGTPAEPMFAIEARGGTVSPSELAWRKGSADWFFRHFDHAARVIIDYLLAGSDLLGGRVLDVGCGDGITDLGVYWRMGPSQMIGVDPFRGYERLPEILAENHLDLLAADSQLRFEPFDANALPFDDDSFDVVLSWGSLEHIAGGYDRALREIRRVLRPDGLFFVHPGLFYSNFGHHLGEFSSEPFFHLKKDHDALREMVLGTEPDYIDRSGIFATPAQYWRWYEELNPITVAGFERELRELGFEPWRAALRTQDLIEYDHPRLQSHSIVDLACNELYVSCWNRKPRADRNSSFAG